MDLVTNCHSYEEARNEALKWMELVGGPIGAHYEIGLATGLETSVTSTIDPYRWIHLEYDPFKGPHFNAEVYKGAGRQKHAFTFPGDESTIAACLRSQKPR